MEMGNIGMVRSENSESKKWYLPMLALGVVVFEVAFFSITAFMVNGEVASSNSGSRTVSNTNAPATNRMANYSGAPVANAAKPAANAPASYYSNSSQSSSGPNSVDCSVGTVGTFSGGNFRSGPRHSVDQANVIAIVDPGSTVKILGTTTGEPRKSTGNINWYRVKFQSGTCKFDPRNRSDVYDCDISDLEAGYINADLITDCYR